MAKKIRRLYRAPKNDSVIAGVCAGVANYFDIDPVIVRVIWVAAAFAYGASIVAYLLAWLIIPRK